MTSNYANGHALVIGVGADLPNTVDDAIGIADILKDSERCAYLPANVTLLTDANATRKGILSSLETLSETTDSESTVIIYFSGHGIRQPQTD